MSDQIRRAKALLESKGYTVVREGRMESKVDPSDPEWWYSDDDMSGEINLYHYFPEMRDTDEYDDDFLEELLDQYSMHPGRADVRQGVLYLYDTPIEEFNDIVRNYDYIIDTVKRMYGVKDKIDPVDEFIEAERKYLNMKTQELVKLARSRQDDMSRDNVDDIALAAACEAHNIHEYAEVDGMHWVNAIERLTGERIMNIISRRRR